MVLEQAWHIIIIFIHLNGMKYQEHYFTIKKAYWSVENLIY